MLMKEIKDLRQWFRRHNITKMSVVPKLIYGSHNNLQNPIKFIAHRVKILLKFICKGKTPK
jgi:hypothetical protein